MQPKSIFVIFTILIGAIFITGCQSQTLSNGTSNGLAPIGGGNTTKIVTINDALRHGNQYLNETYGSSKGVGVAWVTIPDANIQIRCRRYNANTLEWEFAGVKRYLIKEE